MNNFIVTLIVFFLPAHGGLPKLQVPYPPFLPASMYLIILCAMLSYIRVDVCVNEGQGQQHVVNVNAWLNVGVIVNTDMFLRSLA